MKNIQIFPYEIFHFTAEKNLCMLHGQSFCTWELICLFFHTLDRPSVCTFHVLSSLFTLSEMIFFILYLAVKLMYIKKSDIFTAELILIFSLVIDISRYFHCRVWITSDVSIHLTSLNVPHFRNSDAYI